MEYEYSSGGAILLHMHETVLSLLDLCEACGVDLSGIPDPSSPMLPGVAHELLRTYASIGEVPLNDAFYISVCGLCIWLECGVRPDISFALGVLNLCPLQKYPCPRRRPSSVGSVAPLHCYSWSCVRRRSFSQKDWLHGLDGQLLRGPPGRTQHDGLHHQV